MKMKSFTVIMQPHVVAHYLTRRAVRRFPGMSDSDESYLAMFTGVQNIMQAAAASGGLKLLAYPLWWPIPEHMAIDDDGRIVQGAGITIEALFAWMESFDPDIISNRQSLDGFWKELQGDDASTESETKMENGTLIIGDFTQAPHGKKAEWYKENVRRVISEALEEVGMDATRTRVITWAYKNNQGSSNETWKTHITRSLIEAVKNENREK